MPVRVPGEVLLHMRAQLRATPLRVDRLVRVFHALLMRSELAMQCTEAVLDAALGDAGVFVAKHELRELFLCFPAPATVSGRVPRDERECDCAALLAALVGELSPARRPLVQRAVSAVLNGASSISVRALAERVRDTLACIVLAGPASSLYAALGGFVWQDAVRAATASPSASAQQVALDSIVKTLTETACFFALPGFRDVLFDAGAALDADALTRVLTAWSVCMPSDDAFLDMLAQTLGVPALLDTPRRQRAGVELAAVLATKVRALLPASAGESSLELRLREGLRHGAACGPVLGAGAASSIDRLVELLCATVGMHVSSADVALLAERLRADDRAPTIAEAAAALARVAP